VRGHDENLISAFARVRTRQIVLWVVLSLLALVVIYLAFEDPDAATLLSDGAMFVCLVAALLIAGRQGGFSLKRFLHPSPPLSRILWNVPLVLPLIGFSIGVFWPVLYVLGSLDPEFAQEMLESPVLYSESPVPQAIEILGIALIFPIIEELLFRGVLLHRWALKWGTLPAALWSSTIFALLHIDMIGAFVFGLAMCLAYTRTGSLVVPIVLHAVNNALALVLSYFEGPATWQQFIDFSPMVALVFVISTAILVVCFTRTWPRPYWRLPLFAAATPLIPQPPTIIPNPPTRPAMPTADDP
jgi:uncharacterized protein